MKKAHRSKSAKFNSWPAKPLSLSSGIEQAGSYALLNERPLELSHRADDLKHQATRWSAKVEIVAEASKRDDIGQRLRTRN